MTAMSAWTPLSGTTSNIAASWGIAPGPILLLGPPGSGKGPQSMELASRWGIPRISTGDILRMNVSRSTPLGKVAADFMNKGKLVPDDLISEMVADRLRRADTDRGFILDGFPRTVCQAVWLDGFLSAHATPLLVLNIQVDFKLLVSRITRRRICRVCETTYHDEFRPPRAAGICDNDGATLEQRSDDKLEIIQERFNVYRKQTEPIIERYRDSGTFFAVDGDQPIAQVTDFMVSTIHRSRDSHN